MLRFILRRLAASIGILFAASLLLYVLVVNSGDPLAELRESNAENRENLMKQRIEFMDLDLPWYQRYWTWLVGVGKCFTLQCDLGTNRQGIEVIDLLALAAGSTLRLVLLATVLAAVLGIAIGVLTAVRQYSGLDYGVTFLTFLFFSLPVFWAAVLLKEYMAIGYNDWIRQPEFSVPQIVVIALVVGFLMQVFLGGNRKRRAVTFLVSAGFVAMVIPYLTWLNFFRFPQLGFGAVILLTLGVALSGTAMSVGLRNTKVLYPALATVALGAILYFVTFGMLEEPNVWILVGGGIMAVVLPALLGHFMGGWLRSQAMAVSVATGLVAAALTTVDHIFRAWPGFLAIKPRPIATIGSQTPNFAGTFWEDFLDKGAQLLLPTILLAIISLASYSRYTRSSMLEVGQQDYIRTARSKGLSERTVIFRHAFRNAMIPIATIAAFDFAGLIGGAVITESVFGWKGMGELFRTGLTQVDPAPVMAFFLVTGTAAVLFNMLADIFYAILDPRIRV
ncbi:ABC transporter permease [Arthrobacter sp. KK5.5]|uniref:ABC transporter permease n=1 Tax=Arthrobacter sp. KK5.5 TaxID=3373084 RepID=UPI003EE79EBB